MSMTISKPRTDLAWPLTTGPREALLRLGFIKQPGDHINWARNTATRQRDDGTTSYLFTCGFLNQTAVRALAALTFEGYEVRLDAHAGKQILVNIIQGVKR